MKFLPRTICASLCLLALVSTALQGCARPDDNVPMTRADADVQAMQATQAIIFTGF